MNDKNCDIYDTYPKYSDTFFPHHTYSKNRIVLGLQSNGSDGLAKCVHPVCTLFAQAYSTEYFE